jgi:hypothetical protein
VPLTSNEHIVESQTESTTQYRSLLKSFAVRLCVAVTLGVILMAAVELFSYIRYRHYGQNEVLEPGVQLDLAEKGSAQDREYWREFDQSNKVVYQQYVLWRKAPYQGELISVNQQGVRRTLHTQCDGDETTIWMFGDSVMWGFGAPDAGTIPSLIAHDYEKAGKPVCIVNYGEKGWFNTQEMIGLIELLKHAARKPDIVLFYDGGSEAFTAYQSGRADTHSNFSSFQNFLDNWSTRNKAGFDYFRETNSYRLLEKIADKAPFHRKSSNPKASLNTETLAGEVIENYVQNIDVINLLAKQYGFRAIFAWYPNLAVGHKQLTPYEQQVLRFTDRDFPDMSLMYHEVYSRSREINRPNFYNLADTLDDQKSSLYLGISHMKPEGNQIMADRLFNLLESKDSTGAVASSGK